MSLTPLHLTRFAQPIAGPSRTSSAVLLALRDQSRHASSSSNPSPSSRNATLEAEKQLAKVQRQMKVTGLAAGNQLQPLQDVAILPPGGLLGWERIKPYATWRRYTAARIKRWWTNRQNMDMLKKNWRGMPLPYYGGSLWHRLLASITKRSIAGTMGKTAAECEEVWQKWKKAQWTNDMPALEATSKGGALMLGRRNARQAAASTAKTLEHTSTHRAHLEWSLLRHIEPPQVVHIRCLQLDAQGGIMVQLVLLLRYEFEITTTWYNKAPMTFDYARSKMKETHEATGYEYIAFERTISDPSSKWTVRDKVAPYLAMGPLPENV